MAVGFVIDRRGLLGKSCVEVAIGDVLLLQEEGQTFPVPRLLRGWVFFRHMRRVERVFIGCDGEEKARPLGFRVFPR